MIHEEKYLNNLYTPFFHVLFSTLINFIVFVIKNIFFTVRIYRSDTISNSSFRTLVNNIQNLNGLKFGIETYQTMNLPLVVFAWNTIIITSLDHIGIHGNINVVITSYHLSFFKYTPLIQDKKVDEENSFKNDSINILEICGNRASDTYITETTETTIPFMDMDKNILKNSKDVAESIVNDYNNSSTHLSKVYILHGKPGCGKSTTLRIITNMLKGVLFSDYDPTKIHSIKDVIRDYTDKEPLIIGYEEFDISFEKIITDQVERQYENIILDAVDKSSWNNLIDYIKRKQNVIFIMTTNKTIEQIKEITRMDSSYLRYGRVDAHFLWPEKSTEYPQKIKTKEFIYI